MLEGIKYDGRPVESVFRPKDAEGNESNQVLISFADEKEPRAEVMSIDEWEAMSQKVEDEKSRLYYIQDATYNTRKKIMDAFESFNPRFSEIKRILVRVEDDMVKQLTDAWFNFSFGTQDWFSELTPKTLLDAIKGKGKEVDHGDLSSKEQALVQALADNEIPLSSIPSIIGHIHRQMDSYQEQALSSILDVPYLNIRIDDIIKFIDQKLKEQKPPVVEEPIEETKE